MRSISLQALACMIHGDIETHALRVLQETRGVRNVFYMDKL
jgi:hypothetical protein